MTARSSHTTAPREEISFKRPESIPGVEMLRAAFTKQRFARHFHEGYAIGVIEQGALGFRYRGEHVVAPAGSVNLTVPGEPHTGRPETEHGWTYRMFYLEPALLKNAARHLGHDPGALPSFRPGVIEDDLLARRVRELHITASNGRAPKMAVQTGLMNLLCMWISRHADGRTEYPKIAKAPGAVMRVRDLIRERCRENLSLEQLAQEAGMSPFHLVRTFSRHVGLPPHEYLIQSRIERAKDLLAGGAAIPDTALDLGFADQSHFTRHFKRHTGVTPGRWSKIVQDA